MATKTVVCPECGAAAAPGRYACSECGALLAAVAVTPRTWAAEEPAREPAVPDDPSEAPAAAVEPGAPAETAFAHEPAPSAAPVAAFALEPSVTDTDPAAAAASDADGWDAPEPVSEAPPEDAEAPALQWAAEADRAASARDDRAAAAPVPAATPAPAPAPTAAPTWPPAGDHGADPFPAYRTPAGAYLPPSAVLPPLDGPTEGSRPESATAVAAGPAASGVASPARAARPMSAFDALDLSADRPRRVIAAGAGLTAVGFLLPWAGSLLGAGSMSGYFAQWGLAGPGHWLILFAVIALAGIAVAPGPLASRSLLVLSVAVGALLVGLVWPYVVGGFGSIGAWTVLVGALVIAAGGLLDRPSRHGPEDPAV